MTVETRISKEIKDFLIERKIMNWRMQASANLSSFPDRMALYRGVLLGIEVKVPGEEAKLHQLRKLKQITENGGIGIVVDDVKQVEKMLKWIDYQIDMMDYNEQFPIRDIKGNFKSREFYQEIIEN